MSAAIEPVEFDCCDCGQHICSFGRTTVPDPPRCSVCAWVAEFVTDPEEARRIRASPGAHP